MSQTLSCEVLVHVHSMPEWLQEHLDNPASECFIWAQDYQRLIQGANLWKVWMIDADGCYWLEVNYMSDGEPSFNTLKVEPGTFALVDTEPYQVFSEY